MDTSVIFWVLPKTVPTTIHPYEIGHLKNNKYPFWDAYPWLHIRCEGYHHISDAVFYVRIAMLLHNTWKKVDAYLPFMVAYPPVN